MISDTALLDGARRMNEHALAKIFDLYAPALYKYVFYLCSDALLADHIVGDIFVKLLEHLSAGSGPSTNLRSYLYEIAYHLVVDEARYSYRSAPIEVADLKYQDAYSTHLSLEDRMLLETVRRAIQNDLTDDQRHVIVLRFLEGFSLKETAAILGKEMGNIKMTQNRAIAALRTILSSQKGGIVTTDVSPDKM